MVSKKDKQLFDNTMHVIRVEHSNIDDSPVLSVEIDFELTKGIVAKIERVEIQHFIDSLAGAQPNFNGLDSALVRDPDDVATVVIPENETQHDVIADLHSEIFTNSTVGDSDSIDQNGRFFKDINFGMMGLDVITARNMRFNSLTDAAVSDSNESHCTIYYTLHEVTSDFILDLLQIL